MSNAPEQNPQHGQPQKTLADLEAELFGSPPGQSASGKSNPNPEQRKRNRSHRVFKKLLRASLLVGAPIGIIAFLNLPLPFIRRPVARTAPILLLPSYLSFEFNFKRAQATVEEAKQLIDRATSPLDLDRGEERLKVAKEHLDAIPVWFVEEWAGYSQTYRWWRYDWRFSPLGLQQSRVEVGQLEAKVFQEKNAQKTLLDAEEALSLAKQNYQQAKNPIEQQAAIAEWQAAIDQLVLIPPSTLAGRVAKQTLLAAQRDFEKVVGLVTSTQQTNSQIMAAKAFGLKASQASQNAPHSATEWQQIAELWKNALAELQEVSRQDQIAFQEAKRLTADYQWKLGIVKVRLQEEQESVAAWNQANQRFNALITNLPDDPKQISRNALIGDIRQIVTDLEQVKQGTTVYPQAQELKAQAQNKLRQLGAF